MLFLVPSPFLKIRLRSSHRRFFIKNVFLNIPQNLQKYTCARNSFLIMLQANACNFTKKETLAQVLCKFYEIFKNTFLYRAPLDDCFVQLHRKCIYGRVLRIKENNFQNTCSQLVVNSILCLYCFSAKIEYLYFLFRKHGNVRGRI